VLEELRQATRAAAEARDGLFMSEEAGKREIGRLQSELLAAERDHRRAKETILALEVDIDASTASHALDARDASVRVAEALHRAERAEAQVANLEAELRASQLEVLGQRSEGRRRTRELTGRLEHCEDQQATELSSLRRTVGQLQLQLYESQQRTAEASAARTEAQRLLQLSRQSAEAAEARARSAAAAAAADADALVSARERALAEGRALEAHHRAELEQVVRDAHLEQRRLQLHAEAMLFSAQQALRSSEEAAERERWRHAHAVIEELAPGTERKVQLVPENALLLTAHSHPPHGDAGARELRQALYSLAAERWAKLVALLRVRPRTVTGRAMATDALSEMAPKRELRRSSSTPQHHTQWIPVLDVFSDAQLNQAEGVLLRNVISSHVAPYPAKVCYTGKPL
jgi:hypothetical protein